MAQFIDPSLFGSLAFAGLALCLALVGWVLSREGAGGELVSGAPSGSEGPRQLGPYTLVDKIGEGAMGEVYRAWNTALGTWRAVKLLPSGASERERERFEQEARLGAELQHENTVTIYDSGEAGDGTRYYAMELLDGVTLRELVEREGRQAPERVLRILLQLCAALDEAHGKGLVHRDIKPENVVVSRDGVCTLIDFGLAQRMGDVAHAHPADAVVGTPLYISPEAIVAPETVGARSDLYSVGALAYFLLRGAPVFDGRSVVEVCSHHLHTRPEPLSAVLGDVLPRELEQIILQCLAKDAAQRPASAAELGQRLAACERSLSASSLECTPFASARGRELALAEGTGLDASALGSAASSSARVAFEALEACALAVDDSLAAAEQWDARESLHESVFGIAHALGALAMADTLVADAASDLAVAARLGDSIAALPAPLCLAYIRAQRAFDRLDAVLAAEASAAAA